MMKHCHNRILTLCAILLLGSCRTEDLYGPCNDTGTYKLTLSVSGGEVITKFGETGPDDAVNSLKLLVFDKNDGLILYQKTNSSSFEGVELPGKQKLTIYAVANSSDDFSRVRKLDDFLSMRSMAKDSDKDNLVMVGHVEMTLTRNTVVTVPVKRMAAKIVIEYLEYRVPECDNSDTHYPTSIYMDNIASDCPYSLEVVPPTECVSATYGYPIGEDNHSSVSFKHKKIGGETYYYLDEPVVLYAYPTDHNFTKYKPGLVLKFWGCWVEFVEPNDHYNHSCYHWISFQLPDLEANTLYRIPKMSINVSRYGSASSERSTYEIKAECRMETYDNVTGDLTGIQKMEAEVYEDDFDIQ